MDSTDVASEMNDVVATICILCAQTLIKIESPTRDCERQEKNLKLTGSHEIWTASRSTIPYVPMYTDCNPSKALEGYNAPLA